MRILGGADETKHNGPHDRRSVLSLFTTSLCAVVFAAPASADARDLVLYGEPTLEKALRSVGALWHSRTGTRVNVFVAPTDLSFAQIDRGVRCDVIVALAGASTDKAAHDKIIQDGKLRRALRNGLVLVGNEANAGPSSDVSLADISRLIAGKTLAIADPGRDVAGDRAVDLLRKIGIAVDDSSKMIAVAESSAGVVSLLSTRKAQLGIVYATDATTGFKLMVPLPMLEQPSIEYVVARTRDPQLDTEPFMTFLTSAEAKATFKSAGLTPIDE